jgi:hypothetical protein
MTPLTTFSLFASLPPELRACIWRMNLPGPRLVSLHYNYASDPSMRTIHDQAMRGCTSPAPIPSNLHTSHEARQEALKHYKHSFNLPHGKAKIFFDPSVDLLYFGPRADCFETFRQFSIAATMIEASERAKVRRLAVHEDLFRRENESLSSARIGDFWDCVQRKFEFVEEVFVLRGERGHHPLWAESLEGNLAYWLDFLRVERDWKVPNWGIVQEETFKISPGQVLPRMNMDIALKSRARGLSGYCRDCKISGDFCGESGHSENLSQ